MNTKGSRGLSLVELLIAMTIGLILISGMMTVFKGNKRSSQLNNAITDMQESARFVLAELSKEIRQSGNQGCLDINRGKMTMQSKTPPSDNLRASSTSGYQIVSDSAWSPVPPLNFELPVNNKPIPGTHALTLQYAGSDNAQLNAEMTSPAGFLWIDKNIKLKAGDLAVISNCDTADLFTISQFWGWSTGSNTSQSLLQHRATHNTSGNLTRAYGDAKTNAQTRVMSFHSNVYYVGDTELSNDQGDPVRALYMQTLPYDTLINPPVELIQGVENMRVAFGIRESTGNLRYVTPTDAAYDPERVESVKIGLLMTSLDRIAANDDIASYVLADQTIEANSKSTDGLTHPQDKRFRLPFNTTIKIRNRRNTE